MGQAQDFTDLEMISHEMDFDTNGGNIRFRPKNVHRIFRQENAWKVIYTFELDSSIHDTNPGDPNPVATVTLYRDCSDPNFNKIIPYIENTDNNNPNPRN